MLLGNLALVTIVYLYLHHIYKQDFHIYKQDRPNYIFLESQRKKLIPQYHRLSSLNDFLNLLTNFDSQNLGDVYFAPNEDGRVRGAFATLNCDLLKKRKRIIKLGLVKRNDEERKQAFVPGFNHLNDNMVKSHDGKNYALWHRTHCIPFRFCLLDGLIDGVMFAGTAHLNHGDRPNFDYFVDDNEAERRSTYLFNLFFHDNSVHNIHLLDGESISIKNAPNGTHFSLDDLERLSSRIILFDKYYNHIFKYGIYCNYNDNDSQIPTGVNVFLVDTTSKQIVLQAYLPNSL